MKDLSRAKAALVQRYIEEGIVSTPSVIDAFMKVPREEFVLSNMRDSAYDDNPLPIAFGQTISAPHYLATPK
jgi:protein-L-isoaspartate(D-aspartate) O-methyltransferase